MTWSAPPPTGASCRAGPDDTGELRLDRAYLGHQRLSIVDVSGGRQPIANSSGTAWVVGNGEIYNHAELSAGLPRAPWRPGRTLRPRCTW